MSKVKILLVGSVGKNLPVLRKKLKALNASKAGPFDACFCIGPIHLIADDVNGGGEAFSLPVYLQDIVVASNTEDSVSSLSCSDQGIVTLGENLYHLRGHDRTQLQLFEIKLDKNHPTTNSDPLLVASCPRHIRSLTIAGNDEQKSKPKQCDLLLSSCWPQGMEGILNVDTEPLSYDVAEVALQCRPRYHVCPSTMLYHASPPYSLPNSDHVGRFLALAPVTTEKKTPKTAKFIHALGLFPLKSNPGPTTAPSTLPCPFGETSITSNNNNSKNLSVPKFAMQGDTGAYSRFSNTNKRGRDNKRDGDSIKNNTFSLEPPEDPTISTLFLYGLHRDMTGELQSSRSPKVLTSFHKYGVTRVRHPNIGHTQTSTYCFLEFPSQKEAMNCLMDCHGRITIDSVNLSLKWASAPKQQQQQNNKRQRQDDHQQHQQHFVTQAEAKDSTTLFFHPPKKTERDDSEKNKNKSKNDIKDTGKKDDSHRVVEKQSETNDSNITSTDDKDAKISNKKIATITAEKDEGKGIDSTISDRKDCAEDTDVTTIEKKDHEENTDKTTVAKDTEDIIITKEMTFAHKLQQYLQKVLEDALNEGVDKEDERVTAETEPALKVGVRCKDQYGFLSFFSHAAATMALAVVTKSTDGGLLMAEPEGAPNPTSCLVGTTLRWAKGTTHTAANKNKEDRVERLQALGLKRQYFSADGRTDCWFCLSSSTCETHLITGVYDEWYATMAKGPVHQGHILLIPVTHTKEGAWTLNEEWVKLVERAQEHASQVYGMDLFVFERAMETRGGYHTHVQCVPVPRDCTTRLQSVMLSHAKASGFDLRPIQSDLGVKAIIEKDNSYFYAEIRTRTNNQRFLYRCERNGGGNAQTVPLQFAREILASVLNNPKLAHWKSCVVNQEQETKLASDFRTSFNSLGSSSNSNS